MDGYSGRNHGSRPLTKLSGASAPRLYSGTGAALADLDHRAIVSEIATLTERMNQSHRDAEEAKRQRERFDDKLDHITATLSKISSTQDQIGSQMQAGAATIKAHGEDIESLKQHKVEITTGVGIAKWVGAGGLLTALATAGHAIMNFPKR